MPGDYDDIVEIDTANKRKANEYLEQGWRLLNITHITQPDRIEGGPPFVRHGAVYVLGRPRGIEKQESPIG